MSESTPPPAAPANLPQIAELHNALDDAHWVQRDGSEHFTATRRLYAAINAVERLCAPPILDLVRAALNDCDAGKISEGALRIAIAMVVRPEEPTSGDISWARSEIAERNPTTPDHAAPAGQAPQQTRFAPSNDLRTAAQVCEANPTLKNYQAFAALLHEHQTGTTPASAPDQPGAVTEADGDLMEWLRGKVADAEKTLKTREGMAATWRTGTNAEWEAAAAIHPSTAGRATTKAHRLKLAEIDDRIAVKLRHELTMFRALLIRAHVAAQIAQDTARLDWLIGVIQWRLRTPVTQEERL